MHRSALVVIKAMRTINAFPSRTQVKKIYDNGKRLEAGDHSLDLLAHDFEKNYNMYIFPVHWQFGQLDQHPVDGFVFQSPAAPASNHIADLYETPSPQTRCLGHMMSAPIVLPTMHFTQCT